jgi:hypothetical protein
MLNLINLESELHQGGNPCLITNRYYILLEVAHYSYCEKMLTKIKRKKTIQVNTRNKIIFNNDEQSCRPSPNPTARAPEYVSHI